MRRPGMPKENRLDRDLRGQGGVSVPALRSAYSPDGYRVRMRKRYRPVCYGILEPGGKLYMSENCICEDRDVLEYEEVNQLNQLEALKKAPAWKISRRSALC
jgi:hypothetical protein